MFTKGKKRQYLALSVALALGGAWCGGVAYQSVAHAADLTITGAGFTPAAANEAKDESDTVVGAAAGVENDPAKDTAISGKTTEVSGTGTTYALNAYAGYSIGSGNVTYNILDFKAGTLTGSAYAGYSAGSVTGNTATMIGGTVNTLYGGYSLKGDATHNTVTIEKPASAAGTLTVEGDVYGAKVMGKGKAEGNKVKIGGAAVIGQLGPTGLPRPPYRPTSGSVIGGQSEGGDVRSNEVTIENDGEIGKFVYGGLTKGDGKAEGNTVKITKGTVIGTLQQGTGGSVWGGRSVDGAVKNNTVEISGGRLTADPPNVPPVTSPGAPHGTYIDFYVYGGLATGDGAVEGNKVTVTGGTVRSEIFGGRSVNGAVKNNVVKISGAAEETSVAAVSGGKATGDGAAEGNTVEIDSAGVKTGDGDVTGGETDNGDAKGNTVTFTKNAAGSEVSHVYGGYVSAAGAPDKGYGSATDNTVILHAGTIDGPNGRAIYGGYAEKDSATRNKVILEKDVVVVDAPVYGGQSEGNGDASRNEVTLRGDNEKAKFYFVYGGKTSTGHAEGNKVAFHGGKVTDSLVGGEGDSGASSNEVTIEDGDFSATSGWIIGGHSGLGSTDENTVTIHKVVNNTLAAAVTGGKGGASASKNTVTLGKMTTSKAVTGGSAGEAANPGKANENTVNLTNVTAGAAVTGGEAIGGSANENKINMTGGKVTAGDLIGGKTTADAMGKAGDANGNEVTLTNLKAINADIIGGKSASGEASGNTVNLANATVKSITGGDGTVTNDNTVNLEGGTTVTGTLTGGTAANGKGNTLNVKGKDNKAGTIANIQKMNFDATGLAKDDTMLEVTGMAQTAVNWEDLSATGTAAKPLTLLKNANGINLSNYSGAVKSEITGGNTETNIDVVKDSSNKITEITYEGYQFKGVTMATSDGGNLYGGISKAGNSTRENTITVNSGSHTNVYGGHTSGSGSNAPADRRGDSISNNVTVKGSATVSGTVYGGFTDVTGGRAMGNTVAVEKNLNADIIGGKSASGEASGNTVNLANATVKSITGGDGTVTNDNTVNLEGGTTVTGTLTGGTAANGKGNTLNVKGKDNKAGTIANIQKMNFDATGLAKDDTMLEVTGMAQTAVNWEDLSATGTAAKPLTLLKNANGINLSNYSGAVKSEITGGNTETNIDVVKDSSNKITEITYEGYQFKGVTMATSDGGNLYGGISKAGNSTRENTITVNSGSHTNVYGGHTSGAGTTRDDKNSSYSNTVTITGGTVTGKLYGGYTDVAGGKAMGNTVTIEKNLTADIIGGKALGEASGNTVNLANATVKSITGGFGTVTNDNRINLRDAKVTGTVTGGTAASGTGNTLAVYYGTGTSSIGDFGGIQNLHFDLENASTDGTAHTMLNLTNVSGGNKTLSDMNIGFYRSGAAKKLKKGDTFTLVENTTAGGSVSIGDNVKAEGKDGSSRKYEFGITTNAAGELIATVTKAGMGEQSKSIVETRAGASAFLNDGADFTAGPGMDAAKKEARAAAQSGNAPYGIWAGMGGGSLRHETGSYVDMKGWNLGVGWARENAVQAGTLTFGPFIEYGRGSYDSYLDDGTHGSGKTSFIGAGMMAKLETKANTWIDGSLRVGRTKSDYTGLANYDTTSTYYGMQVGAGKDFHVSENDTVGVYVRYAYAHTAGTSAHLSSGETFDFDAVNSHRLRLGTRYTHGMTALSQFYAGLAWEYEFDGDARATSQGDSAPSPSLKGGSALLELGYRFAPQGSRMSYDLSLSGWQGKRQGVTGGVSVKWAF